MDDTEKKKQRATTLQYLFAWPRRPLPPEPSVTAAVQATLVQNPLIHGLRHETLATLAEHATEHTASKGQAIYKPDEAWPYVGIVIEGSLGMFAEGGGRDYLYEELSAGDFFGVSGMFDARDAMARMVVLSRKVRYIAIDANIVRRLCDTDPRLAVVLASVLAQRVRGLTSLLAVQVNQPTMTRMARYLLQHCSDSPGLQPTAGPLPLMTQAQIAAAAGTTKEVAARLIRTLEEANALRRERGHIRFLDRDRIAIFATSNAGRA